MKIAITDAMVEAGAEAQWNAYARRADKAGQYRPLWNGLAEHVKRAERLDARACIEAALAKAEHPNG